MKKILSDVPFWIAMLAWTLALAVLLVFTFETVGQTQQTLEYRGTNTVAVYDGSKILPASPWRAGDRFILSANGLLIQDTNSPAATAPILTAPLVDRIQQWTDAAQNIALGIGAVLLSLAGIWISIKTKMAAAFQDQAEESGAISKVLIKEVQKVATKDFKNTIASAAREAGVGDALHDLVKENTPSTPLAPTPRDYTEELKAEPFPLKPVTLPVVEPTKPI